MKKAQVSVSVKLCPEDEGAMFLLVYVCRAWTATVLVRVVTDLYVPS